jgi:hypothetical protein
MDDREKRTWLHLLRARRTPAQDAMLLDLAAILEQQWFPKRKGGRPKKSLLAKVNSKLKTTGLILQVHAEMMRLLETNGYSPGVKEKAIKNVAKRCGLRLSPGLRKQLTGMDAVVKEIGSIDELTSQAPPAMSDSLKAFLVSQVMKVLAKEPPESKEHKPPGIPALMGLKPHG